VKMELKLGEGEKSMTPLGGDPGEENGERMGAKEDITWMVKSAGPKVEDPGKNGKKKEKN